MTKAAEADRVELSDAALLNSAVQGAREATPVRSDKVEAAKKALADGTLGVDAGKLADALIDHMVDDKS
jgi:flagellar biosynthesis anti-sigma factor FlgM